MHTAENKNKYEFESNHQSPFEGLDTKTLLESEVKNCAPNQDND